MTTAYEYFFGLNRRVSQDLRRESSISGAALQTASETAFRSIPHEERYIVELAAAPTREGNHLEAARIAGSASNPEVRNNVTRVLDRMRKDSAVSAIHSGDWPTFWNYMDSVTPENRKLAQVAIQGSLFLKADALAKKGGLSNLKAAYTLVRETQPYRTGGRMAKGLDVYVLQAAVTLAETAWFELADQRAQMASTKQAYLKIRSAARQARHHRSTSNDTAEAERLAELLKAAPMAKRRLLMRVEPSTLLIADDAIRRGTGSGFAEAVATLTQIGLGPELTPRQIAAALVAAHQTLGEDRGAVLGD